jgi:hypothetical protein
MVEINSRARAPAYYWLVAIVAVLWNAVGAYDYLMTRFRNAAYLESMMPGVKAEEMLAWVDSFPLWAQIGWGLGVWGGVVGALLLLLRSRFAVHAFMASIIGVALTFGYQAFLAPPPPGAGGGASSIMPVIITLLAAAFLAFAVAMRKKGVLV